jgi:hypothetical protein
MKLSCPSRHQKVVWGSGIELHILNIGIRWSSTSQLRCTRYILSRGWESCYAHGTYCHGAGRAAMHTVHIVTGLGELLCTRYILSRGWESCDAHGTYCHGAGRAKRLVRTLRNRDNSFIPVGSQNRFHGLLFYSIVTILTELPHFYNIKVFLINWGLYQHVLSCAVLITAVSVCVILCSPDNGCISTCSLVQFW